MTDLLTRLTTALADRYTVEREIGAGGMATVYLAEDLKHKRKVAVKVLRPELATTLGPDRFVREIEIAAKLTHPHILMLIDSGEAGGFLYYVMPYIEGESLRERLDRDRHLSVDDGIRITDQVASALSYAHEQGVVHRDIKPENILLAGDQAIVADFGIARAVAVAGGERLTGTGLAIGTPAYMSPEQAMGLKDVDARSDVYALGCVVYEMVCGQPPFEGTTPQALLAMHAVDTVPGLRTSDRAIPVFVERAVEKALAKSPDDRFQSANAFAEALTSGTVVARVGPRHWVRHSLVGAALVVVVATLWLATAPGGSAVTRLAVLPFENERNDPTQDFFVDGMHDALITEMGQAGIEVIGRRSVMRYRDDVTPVRDIARELNVDAVIEGFGFREGDSVGIRLRLVDGTTEASLWGGSFGTEARDIVRLYREVTGVIAREIELSLSPEVTARLASAPPVDPAAYEAYLNGMYYWYRLTPQDLDLAEQYFARALEIDPDYALAHKGIAVVWGGRQQFGLVSPAEAAPKVRAAAQRALEADSTIAEVHFTLALLRTWMDWDWEGAEEAFRRALEINPNYAEARAYYSHLLAFLARPDEAMEQADLAVAMDPLNSLIGALTCVTLGLVGRYDEALVRCEETLRVDPTQPVARGGRDIAWRGLGRYDEALEQSLANIRSRGDEELARVFEQAYDEGGFERVSALRAERLVARSEIEFVPPTSIAGNFAVAGNVERALDWLERGLQIGDPQMPYAAARRWPEEVQNHPRFREIRRRMGLPGRD